MSINRISPKSLLHSKWTRVAVQNKEKHFVVVEVEFDESQQVIHCLIEAVMTKNQYPINWRDLKLRDHWLLGWQ